MSNKLFIIIAFALIFPAGIFAQTSDFVYQDNRSDGTTTSGTYRPAFKIYDASICRPNKN